MSFPDEKKQKEFDAFAAYYALVAQRPHTAAKSSRLNQLRSIAIGDFGNGGFQEILRANKPSTQPKEQSVERMLGKAPGGESRRGTPPATNPPAPGSERHKRLLERGVLQESKSAAQEVVAGDNAKDFSERLKRRTKAIADAGFEADDFLNAATLLERSLAAAETFDTETGRTENDLLADAPNLSAKELIEKYGREVIFEKLVEIGEDCEALAEKTDRQLSNLLKRKVAE